MQSQVFFRTNQGRGINADCQILATLISQVFNELRCFVVRPAVLHTAPITGVKPESYINNTDVRVVAKFVFDSGTRSQKSGIRIFMVLPEQFSIQQFQRSDSMAKILKYNLSK